MAAANVLGDPYNAIEALGTPAPSPLPAGRRAAMNASTNVLSRGPAAPASAANLFANMGAAPSAAPPRSATPPLSIRIPASSNAAPNPFNTPAPVTGSPLPSPGANVLTPMSRTKTNLENIFLSENNRKFYNSHKKNVNALIANKMNPFAPKTLKNAVASVRSAQTRANEKRKQEEAAAAKLKSEMNALQGSLMRGVDYNVYDVIPLTFKGDGLGYTAGFGYNFKKGSHYANYAAGFPLKYYRVYGECCDNITKKINRLRQQVENTKKAIKNERERRDQVQRDFKEKVAQDKATAREEARLAKESYNRKLQQEKNAALGEMEAERLTSRARGNLSMSKEVFDLAQAREFELLKRDITTRLKDTQDPIYGAYSRAGIKSFDQLPQKFQDKLFANLRRSPSFKNRISKASRLPMSVLRQYNKARYALGVGRSNRNKTLRASGPKGLGAPAFQKGVKNATAKNSRSFMNRLLGRKPKPAAGSPTLGNAYSAMNQPVGAYRG